MKKLKLDTLQLYNMEQHALKQYPEECCGFLFGKEQDQERKIWEIKAVENSKTGDKRRRFEISPRDYLQAERYALANDLQLLGIYHSHPNHPATPSEHDLKQAVPFFSYVIMSVDQRKVRKTSSWQLIEDRFMEEQIIIENPLETLN